MHYALSVSDCGSVEVLWELVKENLKVRSGEVTRIR
jgi:hypothetical protein